jgi:hypothetical protein
LRHLLCYFVLLKIHKLTIRVQDKGIFRETNKC